MEQLYQPTVCELIVPRCMATMTPIKLDGGVTSETWKEISERNKLSALSH